jgi:hypothetical protein
MAEPMIATRDVMITSLKRWLSTAALGPAALSSPHKRQAVVFFVEVTAALKTPVALAMPDGTNPEADCAVMRVSAGSTYWDLGALTLFTAPAKAPAASLASVIDASGTTACDRLDVTFAPSALESMATPSLSTGMEEVMTAAATASGVMAVAV